MVYHPSCYERSHRKAADAWDSGTGGYSEFMSAPKDRTMNSIAASNLRENGVEEGAATINAVHLTRDRVENPARRGICCPHGHCQKEANPALCHGEDPIARDPVGQCAPQRISASTIDVGLGHAT